ncbi:hypothetical protein FACS1894126_1510 [Alphaproteobacteria bacterium]|nr:hypothetical protein FACS1894126_1510 [Alphaproteobacteria bacterium]
MRLLKCLIIVFALVVFRIDADIYLIFEITDEGYWYSKAYSSAFSGDKTELPDDIFLDSSDDLCKKLIPAETLCFLSGKLREDHPALAKLTVWKYVKNNKLKIPQRDILSLKSDNSKFKLGLEANKWLLEKIKKFWGVNKNVYVHYFYSRTNEKKPKFSGQCLDNFTYGNDTHAMVLMCGPPLGSTTLAMDDCLCILAHEFSHAMCNAAYGPEKFETVTSEFKSPNAIVAGWFLNEALAIVIGNGLFQETVSKSKRKIDLRNEEYCAKGFASELYEPVKDYFDNSKPIDQSFFENAVKLFDKVHPKGYIDPNICLYHLYTIYPDDIKENELVSKIFEKTVVSDFYYTPFSKLTNDKVKDIKDLKSTIMVIFRDKKQLEPLKGILPKFDDKTPISIIHKNKRTYILIKIDDKHSFDDRINELFSRTSN